MRHIQTSAPLVVIILFMVVLFSSSWLACENLKAITINNPDLGKVVDGTYRGSSKVGPVRVTLEVAVKDGIITSIELIRHFNGLGKKAEAIVPRIIEAQSLEVDVVSGATASSKAILLAVEHALSEPGLQKNTEEN